MGYMQCPSCEGHKQVRVIDREWSVCSNCEGAMSSGAMECVHCGHPNYDGSGTKEMYNYHLEACSLCMGYGMVTHQVGSQVVAEQNRGCFAGSAANGLSLRLVAHPGKLGVWAFGRRMGCRGRHGWAICMRKRRSWQRADHDGCWWRAEVGVWS